MSTIDMLKKQISFDQPHEVTITAQGGIGTQKENEFIMDHYNSVTNLDI